jgi:RNA polymerase sigma factor (TIGR02999 family)
MKSITLIALDCLLVYGGIAGNIIAWNGRLPGEPDRRAAPCLLGNPIMSDVTQILSRIESGDPSAAEQLLPLVYDELRKLAAAKLAQEKPGQTLQATALVHEAYLRLVDNDDDRPTWEHRGHFFAAAAEAMRRILIDAARRKRAEIHGGGRQRVDLEDAELISRASPDRLVALDESLAKLAEEDAVAAELVKIRLFAGLSVEQAGAALGLSRATAYRYWTYARAWLRAESAGR